MTDPLVELVALTPNQSGPPDRHVVAPLHSWTSLTVTDELSRPGELSLSIPVDQVEQDARPHMRDPFAHPCEVTVDRDGDRIFAGPVETTSISGDTLQVSCVGLLGWLASAYIDDDVGPLDLEDVDQHDIVAALIDAWQTLDYGHYGIDTSQISSAGRLRTRRYDPSEQRQILDAIERLTDQWDLDVAVDPSSRELRLWTPRRDRDRRAQFWVDDANIDSPDEQRTAAAGEVATVVHAVSNPGGDDETITSMARDEAAMASRFRRGHAISERDISVQATLDDRADAALDARSTVGWEPGPDLSIVVDRDWDDVEPGDRITYDFDAGLGREAREVRVVTRRLTVDADRIESLSIEVS